MTTTSTDCDAATQLKAQLRLQTWMSASFPVGAFTCSHGMEAAIHDGRLHNAETCYQWVNTILTLGTGWTDAVLTNQAYRCFQKNEACQLPALLELNELALALQSGAERLHETTTLGAAFLAASQAWPESRQFNWSDTGQELALPIVIGALGALHAIPLQALLACSLQATTSNLMWVAARLVPLGQNQCLAAIARLEPTCYEISERAQHTSLNDLGTCSLLADLASLQHETLYSRVCRT